MIGTLYLPSIPVTALYWSNPIISCFHAASGLPTIKPFAFSNHPALSKFQRALLMDITFKSQASINQIIPSSLYFSLNAFTLSYFVPTRLARQSRQPPVMRPLNSGRRFTRASPLNSFSSFFSVKLYGAKGCSSSFKDSSSKLSYP